MDIADHRLSGNGDPDSTGNHELHGSRTDHVLGIAKRLKTNEED